MGELFKDLLFSSLKSLVDLTEDTVYELIDFDVSSVYFYYIGIVDDHFQYVLGEIERVWIWAGDDVPYRGDEISKIELAGFIGLIEALHDEIGDCLRLFGLDYFLKEQGL